jgi:hypothetical protein
MRIVRVGLSSLVIITAVAFAASAQTPRSSESLLTKLLRIAGLTATPSQMRGPTDDMASGNIWIADIDGRQPRALTTGGGYRSPIFPLNERELLAMRGGTIVRLGLQGGSTVVVRSAPSMIKLVGVDVASPTEVIVLLDTPTAGSPLASVSLESGRVVPLAFDASSEPQRRMLAQVRAQERTYGDTVVYTKTETRSGLSRAVEWTDVFVGRGRAAPRNVSGCDGVNCVQPALAPDGRTVAFIKTDG